MEQKIAPHRSRTGDWEWRGHIKAEDQIDIFDTQGYWFLGTALETRTENAVREIRVGYRIYSTDGTKKDKTGRLHEGWSEQYDEWIPAYSMRLQR